MTNDWAFGLPVNTDTTNYEWAFGLPYIITESSAGYPYTLAASFVTDHIHLTWTEP